MRFTSVFATLLVFVASAVAAPIDLGQIGQDLSGLLSGAATKAVGQCNVDRFNIVTTLAATGAAVGKIGTSDAATATAVKAAQAGLRSSGEGIAQIALALITGGAPPAAARDQTQKGLTDAQTALQGITDATVKDAVTAAQAKLADAIKDGNAVVADCGGAAAAAPPAASAATPPAAAAPAASDAASAADDSATSDDSTTSDDTTGDDATADDTTGDDTTGDDTTADDATADDAEDDGTDAADATQ